MIRIIMHGCRGRMGQAILNTIRSQNQESERQESELFRLVAGVDSKVDGTEDYPAFQQLDSCEMEADVLIDFSHHSSVPGVLEVSIGHALIGESLYAGLVATVRAYRRIVDAAAARPLNA